MRKINCYLLIFLLLISMFVVFTPSVSASDTLYERYNVGNDGTSGISSTTWRSQTFTIGNTGANINHLITSVKLLLYRINNPGTVTVYIETVNATNYPTNTILATGTTDGDTLTPLVAGEWREIFFTTPYLLHASTRYAIVVKISVGGPNELKILSDDTAPTYTGGAYFATTDSGATWTRYLEFDILFEEYGRTETSPLNLAVSGFTNATISLTWNAAANRTVLIRNATGYPATPYLGTEIYNNTGTSYTDTGLIPGHKYYYRAWNWNGTAFSTNYTSANQSTRPNKPYNTAWVQVGGSINISWLNGTGSNKTVLRMSTTSQPILPQDGTEIYNGTNHFKVQAVSGVFFITFFSYNTTSKLFSSPGVNLSVYFIYINCYDESSGLPITNYTIFFSNPSGSQTYVHFPCNNPHIVNTTLIPQGNDISLIVNRTGYSTRTYIFDITITGNYYINTYLTTNNTLYQLTVISQSGQSISDAKITIKKYINATAGFQNVSIAYTDGAGQMTVYLQPFRLYKFLITHANFQTEISDWIPSDQLFTHTFMMQFSQEQPNMFDYITYVIGPNILDHNTSFTVYYNITCPSGILQWFKMSILLYNNVTNTWPEIWSSNQTTSTGGNISYFINVQGIYGVQCSFQLQGYNPYTFGTPGSGEKRIYTYQTLAEIIKNLDVIITKVAGRSPAFVGNVIVGYTALGLTTMITFVLFTFSPKFSGLGLIAVGIVTAWMKGPLGVISNATLGWNTVVILIILGILLIAWTNMRETGGSS